MQAASSFYPFAAATFAALPLLVWMLIRHGFGRGFREGIGKLPAGPSVAAVAIFSGGLYLVYGPYLEQRAIAQLADATVQVYAAWSMFAPGGPGFPGVLTLALVLAALVLRGRRAPLPIGGDPSFALLASIALVGIVCIGGRSGLDAPPVYSWLAEHVPGFDSVRRPYKMISGIHLAVCILAGLGAAAVLERVPKRSRRYATGALLALALLSAVRADFVGHRHRVLFEPFAIAPPAEEIGFYASLAEAGNAGPILEVPPGSLQHNARRVLLNGYHDRPTSACINAHSPDTPEVLELMLALPNAEAIEQARRLGFTTLVLTHPPELAPSRRWLTRLAKATGPAGPLQPIHTSGNLSAYTLVSPPGQREPD